MRKTQGLTAVIMAASVFCLNSYCPTACADDPFQGIGKGRLLKKLRDDLFGSPDQPERPQPPSQKSNGKPTPAAPQYAAPAARQTSNMAQPQPQRGYPGFDRGNSNSIRQSTADAHSRHQQPTSKPKPTAIPNSGQQNSHAQIPVSAARSNAVVAEGFGMLVETKDDKTFYVTQVDRKGNAAKAGIQRGNMMLKVGGTNLASIEELNEICKILTPGDQLEFEISQHGKENTVMVQFGEAKEVPAVATGSNEQRSAATENFRNSAILRSQQNTAQRSNSAPVASDQAKLNQSNSSHGSGRYDFVPSQEESQYQSVLEQPDSMRPPTRPASYSHGPQNTQPTREHNDDQARRPLEELRAAYGNSILERSR